MRSVVLACGFALALPLYAVSGSSLTMKLTPRVMMAPGLLTVRTTIEADADNRAMEVVAESPSYFRSSRVTLDGDHAPKVNDFVFRSLPPGRYQVTVSLIGTGGQRAVETGWFQVAQAPGQ
jgi:hypothetical protein